MTRLLRLLVMLVGLMLWPVGAFAQGVMPTPQQQFFDSSGNPISGGLLCTYAAGTTTPLATYTDYTLGTANANPVVLNSSGLATVYLSAAAYKFILLASDGTCPSTGTQYWSQDYVSATAPYNLASITGKVTFSASTTLTLASNAVTPTQNVHALDTSGGAQNLNTITTTNTAAGFTLYLTGNNPGSNPVTLKDGTGNMSLAGGDYVLNAATRWMVLILRGSTWYELARSSSAATTVDNSPSDGRCTLTTAVPVTTADVTAATTIYYTPYIGTRIALYDGASVWNMRTFAELSLALGTDTASTPYDLFVYDNGGTATLERLAWTNDTTRATALTLQDGVYVKSGATTRRYVCTYRTTGSAGQSEDSNAKRYVWNFRNRVRRTLRVIDATANWNYTTATWRQSNASTANQVDVVVGLAEGTLNLTALSVAQNGAIATRLSVAIGEDSTSAPVSGCLIGSLETPVAGVNMSIAAFLSKPPAVGRHYYAWLENSTAASTTTWIGTSGALYVAGLSGSIDN